MPFLMPEHVCIVITHGRSAWSGSLTILLTTPISMFAIMFFFHSSFNADSFIYSFQGSQQAYFLSEYG
jgi:hypothetical protein